MTKTMKRIYIKPTAEIVSVRLHSGVLDDDISVGGQSERTKPSDSLGNENRIFDADEEDNGTTNNNPYSLWEWE